MFSYGLKVLLMNDEQDVVCLNLSSSYSSSFVLNLMKKKSGRFYVYLPNDASNYLLALRFTTTIIQKSSELSEIILFTGVSVLWTWQNIRQQNKYISNVRIVSAKISLRSLVSLLKTPVKNVICIKAESDPILQIIYPNRHGLTMRETDALLDFYLPKGNHLKANSKVSRKTLYSQKKQG